MMRGELRADLDGRETSGVLSAEQAGAASGEGGVGTGRFAIICSSTNIEDWQAHCLRHLLNQSGVELALVIVGTSPGGRGRAPSAPWRYSRGLSLWAVYDRYYVRRRSRARRPVEISHVVPRVPTLAIKVISDGRGHARLDETDLATIRGYNLDFILQFGVGGLGGGILSAARFGVWSFSHENEERRYDRPPFFWEMQGSDRRIRIALERLMESPDGRIVLQSGVVKTVPYSYVMTLDTALYRLLEWPARVYREVRDNKNYNFPERLAQPDPPPETRPSNMQVLRFGLILARRFVSALMLFLLREEQWNVGIVDAPIQIFLTPGARPPVRWLPGVKSTRFLADPFVLLKDGALTILSEEFDRRVGKGHISATTVSKEGMISAPLPVLREATHMAYPFILIHEGQIYCVPDTSHANEVALYKATSFPTAWERVATLLEGFAGCDSTVFQHEGRWWLLCSGNDADVDMPTDRSHITGVHTTLYGWYADDLLGPWTPHLANPLKVDVSSSRPAGTPFIHEGHLYRPAQECSSTYGGAVVLNRVIKLTPTEFNEEVVTVIRPYADSPYKKGLHTISGTGAITVIDGKREMFHLPSTLKRIKQLVTYGIKAGMRQPRARFLIREPK